MTDRPCRPVPSCRSCGAPLGRTVVDLGPMPLANALIDPAAAGDAEARFPLHARVCEACWLVQLDHVVAPEILYSGYVYFSSVSEGWVAHARRFAEDMIGRLGLGADSRVIEVASNDGYLLRHFVDRGVPVLGIEPAETVAAAAEAAGVPTLRRFLDAALAEEVRREIGPADLLVANNVLAHAADPNDFVAAAARLLADDGWLSVEVPHLLRLIEEVQFDTIYHEHGFYLSLGAVVPLFERHGLRVASVVRLPTHGGSLRILARPAAAPDRPDASVAACLAEEERAGLTGPAVYEAFAARAEHCRAALRRHLDAARGAGIRILAYGAAAKGATLLNASAVTTADIAFVADKSPAKQGKLMPGCRLPIRSPDAIVAARPDEVLILPWNLADEIVGDLETLRRAGTRFLVPVPEVGVVG